MMARRQQQRPSASGFDIEVRTYPGEPHACISVTTAFDPYDHPERFDHPPSDREVLAAWLQAAGRLARLFVLAAPAMEDLAAEHRCNRRLDTLCCQASAGGFGLGDEFDCPNVWFAVPKQRAAEWTKRIREWLVEVAAIEGKAATVNDARPEIPPSETRANLTVLGRVTT
jgi:hypothetical protein